MRKPEDRRAIELSSEPCVVERFRCALRLATFVRMDIDMGFSFYGG
jgi:hypothetical protein